MSIVEKLLEELRQREDLRDALAQELVSAIFKNSKLRAAMLTALHREIATKSDLKELEERLRVEAQGLRTEVHSTRDELRKEVNNVKDELRREIKEIEEKLKKEIKETEERLRKEIEELEERLRGKISNVEERLRREIDNVRGQVSNLEQRIDNLSQHVAGLEGTMNLFVKLFIAFNLPILMAVIGILLKMIL